MISVDSNILLYGHNTACSEHRRAFDFVTELATREHIVICELVLVELYLLLRNPAILERPLSASDAVEVCETYRSHPRWRLVEHAPVMDEVWKHARGRSFARRRIIDVRLALTLRHHGVTQLATANVKDFNGFGFARVWNPVKA